MRKSLALASTLAGACTIPATVPSTEVSPNSCVAELQKAAHIEPGHPKDENYYARNDFTYVPGEVNRVNGLLAEIIADVDHEPNPVTAEDYPSTTYVLDLSYTGNESKRVSQTYRDNRIVALCASTDSINDLNFSVSSEATLPQDGAWVINGHAQTPQAYLTEFGNANDTDAINVVRDILLDGFDFRLNSLVVVCPEAAKSLTLANYDRRQTKNTVDCHAVIPFVNADGTNGASQGL